MTSQTIVFEIAEDKKLENSNTIGNLIQLLLSILEENPEYVRAEFIPFYTKMLRDLSEYTYHPFKGLAAKVGTFPINDIDQIMRQWILDNRQGHLLSSSYCIEMAEFIRKHLQNDDDLTDWTNSKSQKLMSASIRPISNLADHKFSERCVIYTGDKNHITQSMIIKKVIVEIPEGAYLECKGGELHGPITAFMEIERCHLSSNGFYNYKALSETTPPRFDISKDFTFQANLFLNTPKEETWESIKKDLPNHLAVDFENINRIVGTSISGFWISRVYQENENGEIERVPVQFWND